MESLEATYRPHNAGHNYFAPGIYLITLVVRHRATNATLLGRFNDSLTAPAVINSALGEAVMQCWEAIPSLQAQHGRPIKLHGAVCMPDHFHGVIEVLEAMDVSIGEVIRGFKAGTTKAFHRLLQQQASQQQAMQRPSMVAECRGSDSDTSRPINEALSEPLSASVVGQPYLAERLSSINKQQAERELLKRLSNKQRASYYKEHPETLHPLWDDNYDDTICLSDPVTGAYSKRHLHAMIHYVDDNPRRAIIRRLRPAYTQRCLHMLINVTTRDGTTTTRDYTAFGNFFLLRWPRKVQVFCHRRDPRTLAPYETTEEFKRRCNEWKRQIMQGATVIVTPGISRGELFIKNRCIESGYPLIHLQKEPIGRYWKPEESRFEACCRGRLLILAPWKTEEMGEVNGIPSGTDYSVFHNLNTLATEICNFDGEAQLLHS